MTWPLMSRPPRRNPFDEVAGLTTSQRHPSGSPAHLGQTSELNPLYPIQPGLMSPSSEHVGISVTQEQNIIPEAGAEGTRTTGSSRSSPSFPQSSPHSPTRGSYNFMRRVSSASQPSASTRGRETEQTLIARAGKHPKTSPSSSTNPDVKAKAAHSVVERRYRDKLNDKMLQLHRTLMTSGLAPSLFGESTMFDDPMASSVSKVGKAEIMTNAINYVTQAELQMRHMTGEIEQLRNRVLHLEFLLSTHGHPMTM